MIERDSDNPQTMLALELAVALSCTDHGCQVQFLDSGVCADARYSEPMIEHRITVRPGHLVVVDRHADPPRVVFRWKRTKVEWVEGRYVLSQNGHPVEPDRLRAECFPEIRTMYRRLEVANAVDPKQVVEEGYDRIAERYLEWVQSGSTEQPERYTSVLLDRLPPGAEVLDLGCGAGIPTTRALAQRFRVTGVDISARQIALARQNVPNARFIQADMTQLDLPTDSFDGTAAFYALIHVPRQEQSKLLRDIATWLRPGGLLVATMGAHSVKAGYEEDWLGAPMYWSSFDSETNRRLVQEAGLCVLSAQEETTVEFDEPVTFFWVIARKPGAGDHL